MIALDIDGVVANPYDEVNRRIKEAGYKVINWEEWTEFDITNIYDWAPKKFIKSLFRDKLVMKNAIPFEDSWRWINHKVFVEDETVVLVTYRSQMLDKVTWGWCYDWEIPVKDIIHVNSGTKSSAIFKAEEMYGKCSHFVEDKALNAVEVASVGINSYLINRPYNRYDDSGKATRIDSLWDIK